MIRTQALTKKYGELEVLKDVSLEIQESELVSIVGSSGAGKTTLLQILGTLEKPSSGIYTLNNTAPFDLSENELARFRNTQLGFVFQFHQLLPEFTALENAILPALIKGASKNDAEKKAKELFTFLNLHKRDHHKPSQLSGGEQQRVAVARALINSPKVILADEPSGNLDTKNSEELHQLFFDLRSSFGQTFVIVTHNEQLASISDRKLTMQDGILITSK